MVVPLVLHGGNRFGFLATVNLGLNSFAGRDRGRWGEPRILFVGRLGRHVVTLTRLIALTLPNFLPELLSSLVSELLVTRRPGP